MDTTVKGRNKWANSHSYHAVDFLRMALGVFLFMKGVSFITDSRGFGDVAAPITNFMGGMLAFHYIASAHILGGIMIFFGLLARWSIIAQLPILIGAVALNFIGEMNLQNFIVSFLTLGVAVFFLYYGSGRNSADYYFKMGK